jgi:putative ABC transport system ATP-binding protein
MSRASTELATPGVPEPGSAHVLVRCLGVERTFRRGRVEVRAVRDVDCVVSAGVRIALVGPSGSGKSTLLHLLAGLDRPTAGLVERAGLGASRTAVGVVFQGPSLIASLDVAENVALPLVLSGVAEREAADRAVEALDRLGLRALSTALPETLSGGQAQRVAVARVLAGRPVLVLADEPTGQLDRENAGHVVDVLLETVHDLGAALVVSTHDEAVASRMDTRWGMADGMLHPEAGR